MIAKDRLAAIWRVVRLNAEADYLTARLWPALLLLAFLMLLLFIVEITARL